MNPTPQGAVRRRLAAILSTDAVRYSSLMAEDDVGTLRALEGHLDVMAAGVSRHGGRVVDSVGDNLLAELPSVMDAVLCAQEVQDALRERNQRLASAIDSLRHDPYRIEALAREELGLCRPGEITFLFSGSESASAE